MYDKLPSNYKFNDQCLRGINTFFARGLGPIVHVWDKILKWEAKLRQGNVQNVNLDGKNLTFDNLKVDIAELRKDMDKGIKLLAMGNCVVLDKRRVQLKVFFDSKYHHLFKPSNPPTTWLLGDGIDQKIMDFNKVHEAAQKIQFRSRINFHHKNRFRPYTASHSRGRRNYHNVSSPSNFNHDHRNPNQGYGQNNYSRHHGGSGSARFNFLRKSRNNNYRGHSSCARYPHKQ